MLFFCVIGLVILFLGLYIVMGSEFVVCMVAVVLVVLSYVELRSIFRDFFFCSFNILYLHESSII